MKYPGECLSDESAKSDLDIEHNGIPKLLEKTREANQV